MALVIFNLTLSAPTAAKFQTRSVRQFNLIDKRRVSYCNLFIEPFRAFSPMGPTHRLWMPNDLQNPKKMARKDAYCFESTDRKNEIADWSLLKRDKHLIQLVDLPVRRVASISRRFMEVLVKVLPSVITEVRSRNSRRSLERGCRI